MFLQIQNYCDHLALQFDTIPDKRKALLEEIAIYITNKRQKNKTVNLVYICTHNSRRSHFGQIWSNIASKFYQIEGVISYSGGTEATAFNINAINALKRIGFIITQVATEKNPVYHVLFSETEKPIECFSKVYDDAINPQKEFAAIMTCNEAEENCPFLAGAELRIGTAYDDPKAFDNTALQDKIYDESCSQIALETLYLFSKVKNNTKNNL
ncbi:MAG: protein-tyrosine-phosphatase [Bacteroidetes bacterium]|nr:protein-tyrosine-phosphatase [Bacteroidota bacterium]